VANFAFDPARLMSPKNSAHSTPVLRIDKALRLVAEAPGRSVDSSAGGLARRMSSMDYGCNAVGLCAETALYGRGNGVGRGLGVGVTLGAL